MRICCCSPYLFAVSGELERHHRLLALIGVPPEPSPAQYVAALSLLAEKQGEEPLDDDQLALVVGVVEGLGLALEKQPRGVRRQVLDRVYLPDNQRILVPASELYVNDASWLQQDGLRMVHESISCEAAAAVNAQSLRLRQQVETQSTVKLPCTPGALLQQLLQTQDDSGGCQPCGALVQTGNVLHFP